MPGRRPSGACGRKICLVACVLHLESPMANDFSSHVKEVFSAPIESLIIALGFSIAEAQKELDRNSIKTQEMLDTDPTLAQFGLQATWYQFPRVDLQLKMALSVVQSQAPPPTALTGVSPLTSRTALLATRIAAQPVSAAYQNHFNYNAEASSLITLSIVPVPPPRAADQTTLPPQLTSEAVQSKALGTGKFKTATDGSGKNVPDAKLRFDINFNSAARLWYVLQYDPLDPNVNVVVVSIDDQTGVVRIISA